MSEICRNLWQKLNEYKRNIDFLKEENLESTFKGCKTQQDFEEKLEYIKFEINNALENFNNAKLVDIEGYKVIWQDANIIENLGSDATFQSSRNKQFYNIRLENVTQDKINEISRLKGIGGLKIAPLSDLSQIDLSKLHNLKELDVNWCRQLTQTNINEISQLKGLEKLDLGSNNLYPLSLSCFYDSNIKELYLNHCDLTSKHIEEISKINGLEEISLKNNFSLEIKDLKALKRLKGTLKLINIYGCDSIFKHIDEAQKMLEPCEVISW